MIEATGAGDGALEHLLRLGRPGTVMALRRSLAIQLGSRNDGRVDRDELQSACKEHKIYNRPNFTQAMKADRHLFQVLPTEGRRIIGWTLTQEARALADSAAALIAARSRAKDEAQEPPSRTPTDPSPFKPLVARAQDFVDDLKRAAREFDDVRLDRARAEHALEAERARSRELASENTELWAALEDRVSSSPPRSDHGTVQAAPGADLTSARRSETPESATRICRQNLLELLEWTATQHPKKIVLTQNARKTAQKAQINEWFAEEEGRLIGLLRSIVGPLHDMAFGGKLVPERFLENTGHWLALSEGRSTNRNKRLMAKRKYRHDGRKFEVDAHLGYGKHPPRLVRIYLSFDRLKSLIVIHHAGDHMETTGTRRCGLPPRGY